MGDRLDHRRQARSVRWSALGQRQPTRRRRMGVGRAKFESLVLYVYGMRDGDMGIKPRPLQTRHLACHPRHIVVGYCGGETVQRALLLLFRRRVSQIHEDLAGAQFNRIGANGIATDQRLAGAKVKFPVVPIAGQNAAWSFGALAQGIALMWAAIGDSELPVSDRQQQNLFACPANDFSAAPPKLAFADARGSEHGGPFSKVRALEYLRPLI